MLPRFILFLQAENLNEKNNSNFDIKIDFLKDFKGPPREPIRFLQKMSANFIEPAVWQAIANIYVYVYNIYIHI